jgi:hypothetical protein
MSQSEARRKAQRTSADISGRDAICTAAYERFHAIHKALIDIGEGEILPRKERRQAREALEQARAAVSSLEAKLLQIEAAGGRPLTVCFGRRIRRIEEMMQFVGTDIAHTPFGDGCGVVFPDSVSASRPIFRRYCSRCREKPGGRIRSEILARSIAASEGRIAVAGGWRLSCHGCGERFFTQTPQRRRCEHCRH